MATDTAMIREARASDISRIVEMGLRFHNESRYRDILPANPKQIKVTAEKLITDGIFLVDEHDEQLVGMIGGFKFPHFISGQHIVAEVCWWVEPEHRGRGLRLMREFEVRSREAGADAITMIAPTREVALIYKRLGYFYIESGYGKAL